MYIFNGWVTPTAIDEYGVIENMYVVGDITTTTAKQFGIAIGQATLTAAELIEKL